TRSKRDWSSHVCSSDLAELYFRFWSEKTTGGTVAMKVKDRGTMRWVSLMLPEHVEMLNEVFIEYKEKPVLDEQKMSEIDRTLKYASKHRAPLEMTYFYSGEYW